MTHHAWIEREEPLARCPRKDCRRSGRCHRPASNCPCQCTHETRELFRWNIERKVERLAAEARSLNPDPGNVRAEGGYEFKLKLKAIKELFWESDRADCERQNAEAEAARKAARARPPAKLQHGVYEG